SIEKVRRRRKGKDAGHVQDGPAAALLQELPHRGAIGQEDAFQIRIEGHLPAGLGALVQRPVAMGPSADSGDMIHYFDTAQALRGFRKECCDLRARSRVASEKRDVAKCPQLLYGAGSVAVVKAGNDKACAFLQEAPCGRQTDAARAADNETTFAFQPIRHETILPFSARTAQRER